MVTYDIGSLEGGALQGAHYIFILDKQKRELELSSEFWLEWWKVLAGSQ